VPKIVLLTPIAPFRGGIARHSGALARGLSRADGVDLVVESFARLYPRALYPGADDRDPDGQPPAGVAVHYGIDSLNPLSWRRAVDRIAAHRPALVAIPAWTFFVAPVLATIARALRRRGIRVAAIVHNVGDHDGSWWKQRLSEWQLREADVFITHGEALADPLRRLVPDKPVLVCPHPAYTDYPAPSGCLPREHALELLCFGLVRPYKGVDIAIEAMGLLGHRDVRLTIAGEVWGDVAALRHLAARHGVADRVEFIPHYVPDQEAAELFARADAVLAPYRSVTGSGAVALAAHYRRPVVASDLPGLTEVIAHGRNGWLFTPGDAVALAGVLDREVTRDRAAELAAAAIGAGESGWDDFAAMLLDG
jgi:glycosyltransferase involved in cell wall biosynthesis